LESGSGTLPEIHRMQAVGKAVSCPATATGCAGWDGAAAMAAVGIQAEASAE
jgi:hypothetical protein